MIFGCKKRAQAEVEDPADAELDADQETDHETDGEPEAESADEVDGDSAGDDETDPGPDIDVEALDSTEWRTDGPFEVSELTADDHDDDGADGGDGANGDEGDGDGRPRIDLGSLILSPTPGTELRLQVNEAQAIVSAMIVLPIHGPATNGAEPEVIASSALELSAYAAPRSGGLWAELRDEISAATVEGGGSADLAEGPFGVELRRLLPVTTPDGEQGYQPSRMWVAEGPRWLLRGIVYGQAAIESDDDEPSVAAVLEAFRSVVVRRGDEAMAPGDLLPMTMPADLQPAG